MGAQELQNNVPLQNTSDPSDLLIHTPTERFLEAMATNLDVENLKNENQCINLVLSDTQENFSLWVENSIMQFKRHDDSKDLASDCPTLTVTKPLYLKMITGQIKGVKSCFLTKVKSKAIHWKLENSLQCLNVQTQLFQLSLTK